ncbi:MAG: cation-transporting P-type ATPase [Methanobacteriota archaeon]
MNLQEFTSLTVEETLSQLHSSTDGLQEKQIASLQKEYGYNELLQKKKKTILRKIVEALIEPMAIILIIASVISFLIQQKLEAVAILGVVIVNTIISLIQEGKAEKAAEELKKILSPQCKVLRNGNVEVLSTKFIVPGDVLIFESGDILPTDARVIEATNLLVDEAHLTGESEPIQKTIQPIPQKNPRLYEMKNTVFAGSKILNGAGKAVVITIGKETEIGKIAMNIQEAVEERTPIQKKMDREVKFLVLLAIASLLLVLGMGVLRNVDLGFSVLLSISIMVAVFPEGLPASMTIALSLAMERLAKNSVIIKKLSSVETLGNVDYICTDKTGTITKHDMTVKEFFIGTKFHVMTDMFKMIAEGESTLLRDIFFTAIKCSTAQVVEQDGNIITEMGDPTEIALIKAAYLNGFKPNQFETYNVIESIPFSSELMFSAILTKDHTGTHEIYIKGAPERLLEFCDTYYIAGKRESLDEKHRHHIHTELATRSEKGYRLIGFIKKHVAGDTQKIDLGQLTGFTFLATAAIYDPPKDEVKQMIQETKDANINIVMITGDSKNTGFSIAEHVGIATDINQVIDGKDLEQLSNDEFGLQVEQLRVYSRVAPLDKLKIVDKLREKNHIVAMTGDGVNDAPALKKADVGIAMGRAGTQVSQEAADIILTDDNLSTIVNAIEEGRRVYQNLKKLIRYLITNNIGKVLGVVITPLIMIGAAPLTPLQLLWSNVIMESLPSIGISTDPADKHVMKRKPSKLSEPIISRSQRSVMILDGIMFGIAIMAGYILSYQYMMNQPGVSTIQAKTVAGTISFIITLLSPQIYVFILREGTFLEKFRRKNLLLKSFFLFTLLMILGIMFIPALNTLFSTTPIYDWRLWVLIIGFSLLTTVFHTVCSENLITWFEKKTAHNNATTASQN